MILGSASLGQQVVVSYTVQEMRGRKNIFCGADFVYLRPKRTNGRQVLQSSPSSLLATTVWW